MGTEVIGTSVFVHTDSKFRGDEKHPQPQAVSGLGVWAPLAMSARMETQKGRQTPSLLPIRGTPTHDP